MRPLRKLRALHPKTVYPGGIPLSKHAATLQRDSGILLL
jgi:hypothetical protein